MQEECETGGGDLHRQQVPLTATWKNSRVILQRNGYVCAAQIVLSRMQYFA